MVESTDRSAKGQQSLALDLLDLYDEVTDFNDCCAFLCDAFAALAASEQGFDSNTVEGLRSLSEWMKGRLQILREELKEIHRRAALEGKANSRR